MNLTNPTSDGNVTAVEHRLLTLRQAAHALQIGRCTAQDLVNSGQLRSLKIGRLRRIPVVAIDEYIASALKEAA